MFKARSERDLPFAALLDLHNVVHAADIHSRVDLDLDQVLIDLEISNEGYILPIVAWLGPSLSTHICSELAFFSTKKLGASAGDKLSDKSH